MSNTRTKTTKKSTTKRELCSCNRLCCSLHFYASDRTKNKNDSDSDSDEDSKNDEQQDVYITPRWWSRLLCCYPPAKRYLSVTSTQRMDHQNSENEMGFTKRLTMDIIVSLYENMSANKWRNVRTLISENPGLAVASLGGVAILEHLLLSRKCGSDDPEITCIAEMLTDRGASVHADVSGSLSLLALAWPNTELIKLLISRGADPSLETKHGEVNSGHTFIQIMSKHRFGAFCDYTSVENFSILFRSVHTPTVWTSHNEYVNNTLKEMLSPDLNAPSASDIVSKILPISKIHLQRCRLIESECRRCVFWFFSSVDGPSTIPTATTISLIGIPRSDEWKKKQQDLSATLGTLVLEYAGF